MRLIDADALKKCAIPCQIHNEALTDLCVPLYQIDNAPTVFDDKAYSDGYAQGTCDCEHAHERPQGDLNNAIKLIKAVCKDNNTCNTCPMNWNCNEPPSKWEDAKGSAE